MEVVAAIAVLPELDLATTLGSAPFVAALGIVPQARVVARDMETRSRPHHHWASRGPL